MYRYHFAVVQSLSHVWLFATHGLHLARFPHPSPSPGACSNSCPLSRWCHPTISSSAVPFFSCLQSFPESGSFLMSQFFTSGGQSIGVSASASVLPMNIQGWFPLGWTGWISLQSKGLSRVFSSTTVQSINSSALSLLYGPTLTSVEKAIATHSSTLSCKIPWTEEPGRLQSMVSLSRTQLSDWTTRASTHSPYLQKSLLPFRTENLHLLQVTYICTAVPPHAYSWCFRALYCSIYMVSLH